MTASDRRKPHVIYAIYDAAAGGAVLSITRRQAEYLVDRGYDVTLVTNSRDINWNGVTTRSIPACDSKFWEVAHRLADAYSRRLPRALSAFSLRKFVDQFRFPFSAARAIAKLASEEAIDGVVACQHVLAVGLKPLRDKTGIPFVIMSHGDIFEHPPGSFSRAITWLYEWGAKEASRTADGILTVSGRLRERAISLGAPTERVDVVYNGVDLNEIESDPTHIAKCCDTFQILAVGRLSAEKGIDVLLKSMTMLPPDGFHLRIAGVGQEDKNLEAMVRDLHLQGRVEFLGAIARNQIASYYRGSDVLVIPSRSEAFSLVAIEAMACGMPIIATRVGGLTEVIDDGINGVLVSANAPDELARALNVIQSSPDRRRGLSTAAIAKASTYAWPPLLARFEFLLRKVIAHSRETSSNPPLCDVHVS